MRWCRYICEWNSKVNLRRPVVRLESVAISWQLHPVLSTSSSECFYFPLCYCCCIFRTVFYVYFSACSAFITARFTSRFH